MMFYIKKLKIEFQKSTERLLFKKVNYLYGQMGAGKTSIAKLIDYCLGGELENTPAMQQEFISAKLTLLINGKVLEIERPKDSTQVILRYKEKRQVTRILIPARVGESEIFEDSGIFNLSDFIYVFSGIKPPKVRKSKVKEDSELQRLSVRNLLWYNYLDQDNIDSTFFYLEREHTFKRLNSRDVLRSIIGFHQEKVAEKEYELNELRDKRRTLNSAAQTLQVTLDEMGIDDIAIINQKIIDSKEKLKSNLKKIEVQKKSLESKKNIHATDHIKNKLRYLFTEIDSLEESIEIISNQIDKDTRHLNELQFLKLKVHRSEEAQKILKGIEFKFCPLCAKTLIVEDHNKCTVCGQDRDDFKEDEFIDIETDANQRIDELKDSIKRHSKQMKIAQRKLEQNIKQKKEFDEVLNIQLQEYDSAYISTVLEFKEENFKIQEKINSLQTISSLPQKVSDLLKNANDLSPKINDLNAELKNLREAAEKDTTNLKLLETKFLEYLNLSHYPGVKEADMVQIKSPNFLPEVIDMNIGDLATTTFSNVSSGGKKTLFKACFALAFHFISEVNSTLLPSFLIIDSPMKNISERENIEQFESFISLVYDLALNDLKNIQFFIIDKEYYPPKPDQKIDIFSRHMQPNSEEFPPLIPYYKGH